MTDTRTRPSRDEVLMHCAYIWASRGTCSRLQVGAVFARDGRILVTGYNGAPAGLPHCDHTCICQDERVQVKHTGQTADKRPILELVDSVSVDGRWHSSACPSIIPCTIAEHAERNGIAYAARHGVRLEGAELFLTDSPCLPCSMAVVNAGVERVVYDREYRLTDGIELLREAGIAVERFDQS